MNITQRLIVSGKVQGVGFRAFVKLNAEKLGLDGFVRNRSDGSVEALVSGEAHKVEALIEKCHEGPPASRVSTVQVNDANAPAGKGFHHLPTL